MLKHRLRIKGIYIYNIKLLFYSYFYCYCHYYRLLINLTRIICVCTYFINNNRYELIQQSKVVLVCLELDYQNDWNSKLELANNRGFKQPRPVIPLFLESRNQYFPDTEISAQCFLGRSDAKVFDISSFSFNSLHQDNIGISPLQMELERLIGI